MNMAESDGGIITENPRAPQGRRWDASLRILLIAGIAGRRCEKFSSQNVGVTITVTPCWCYGSETIDNMDPMRPKPSGA